MDTGKRHLASLDSLRCGFDFCESLRLYSFWLDWAVDLFRSVRLSHYRQPFEDEGAADWPVLRPVLRETSFPDSASSASAVRNAFRIQMPG